MELSNNLKKTLYLGLSAMMVASLGAGISNVNANASHVHHARTHRVYKAHNGKCYSALSNKAFNTLKYRITHPYKSHFEVLRTQQYGDYVAGDALYDGRDNYISASEIGSNLRFVPKSAFKSEFNVYKQIWILSNALCFSNGKGKHLQYIGAALHISKYNLTHIPAYRLNKSKRAFNKQISYKSAYKSYLKYHKHASKVYNLADNYGAYQTYMLIQGYHVKMSKRDQKLARQAWRDGKLTSSKQRSVRRKGFMAAHRTWASLKSATSRKNFNDIVMGSNLVHTYGANSIPSKAVKTVY